MEFSDRILAAWIGAGATLLAALFQLSNSIRSMRSDSRAKPGRTLRSIVAVVALMGASAAGGFMVAEIRQQRTAEDLRSMRHELNAKLQSLAAVTERLAAERATADRLEPRMFAPAVNDVSGSSIPTLVRSVQSEVYLPACNVTDCTEDAPQRTSACGLIPSAASVTNVEYFLAAVHADAPKFVQADTAALNGMRVDAEPIQHPLNDERKSVCVSVVHWSEQPYIVRVLFHFDETAPTRVDPVSTPAPTVVSIDAPLPTLPPLSFEVAHSP